MSRCVSCVVGYISHCALGCAVTRRYDDFDLRIVFGNGVISRFAVTGAVGGDLTYCMFDLIEQWAHLGWVIDILLCQHRGNDQPRVGVHRKMQFPPATT